MHNDLHRLLLAGTVLGLTATTAMAQNAVFTGDDVFTGGSVEDRVEDIGEDVEDDLERDVRVGNEGRTLGFSSSIALRGTATDGNTDTVDVGIGAILAYYDGLNGYELQFAYDYGESDGDVDEESLIYDFEYVRDFTPRVFGFATVQGTLDEFSNYESDTFVGFGLGYRVYDTPQTRWSLQAGPGYRIADLEDLNQVDDFEEPAIGVESRFYQSISETAFFSNDTNVIASETDTYVVNDLGVTMSMTNSLALRTSLLTEWHSDPFDDAEATDNRLGVSLIYTFN